MQLFLRICNWVHKARILLCKAPNTHVYFTTYSGNSDRENIEFSAKVKFASNENWIVVYVELQSTYMSHLEYLSLTFTNIFTNIIA